MFKKLAVLLLSLFLSSEAFALCSNCKAVVESNDEYGNGLNTGIFMLMLVPYLLLVVIVLVAFKGKIRSGIKNFVNS